VRDTAHSQQLGDEDTLVREFCRHTHNTQDSCAHKHVRVRTTNKRLKPNGAAKGPSSDEGEALRSLLALCEQ
jgi:ABC-type nickel/cobalt efflux system permease component RcnA